MLDGCNAECLGRDTGRLRGQDKLRHGGFLLQRDSPANGEGEVLGPASRVRRTRMPRENAGVSKGG